MMPGVTAPLISVVVPTRGRPDAIATCLASLGRSSLAPEAIEIIVVGDGADVSAPPPQAAGAIPVTWRRQPHSGPAAARNLGARIARAPVLAFTDDDCAPQRDWAARMLAQVEAAPAALAGGVVCNGLPENPWSAASQLVLEVVVDMYNGRPDAPGFVPTSNLALRRDVFEALGGFDERFRSAAAEDRDFCDRAHAAGYPLVIVPEAIVDHFHDLDVRGFCRQSAAYGRGEVTYRAVCAEQGRPANVVRHSFYQRLVRAGLKHGARRGSALIARAAVNQLVFLASYGALRLRPSR
jgi:GT2 family glycosyltransferase